MFKERIKDGEVLVDFDFEGRHYNGIVQKYTGTSIRIEGESFKHTRFDKIKNLKLSDKDGNKIEDIL
jgi:hypothetical protein